MGVTIDAARKLLFHHRNDADDKGDDVSAAFPAASFVKSTTLGRVAAPGT
jgi:hypothetical protein